MMSRWVLLLVVHVVLLVLASTSFTAITGLKDSHYEWEYFKYVSQTGWGMVYQFPYSLPAVLAYLGAYGAGIAAYVIAWKNGSRIIAASGVFLCTIGLSSSLYELTHWVNDHYRSWIVSAPAAVLLLAIPAAMQQYRFNSAR